MQYNLREILRKNVVMKNLSEVKLLLDHHPHLLSEHKNKFNLINIAIQNNDVSLMNLLSNYNINPNIQHKGLTSLHVAIKKEVDIQIIKTLIALSPNLNVCDKYGNTSMHFAAKTGNRKTIAALINAGANINYMNHAYTTPLEIAQKHGKNKAACLLIRAGAKKKFSFLTTLKTAYLTANIYRKITIFVFTLSLISINTIASILTHGLLFPTIIISILASLGVSIVCLAKPFFRVKALERKIMNQDINRNELNELFRKPETTIKSYIPATDLAPDAINDNFFLVQYKNNLEKNKTPKQEVVN